MTVIGITGGIGSGKSTVAEMIASEGFRVVSTDEMAKSIMAGDPEVRKALLEEFGQEVYGADGSLNRKYLASRVFGLTPEHDAALAKLNAIVHPKVIDEMIETVKRSEEAGETMLFIESALIYEAELDEGFDYIIVVDVPEEIALKRVAARTGASPEQILPRMKAQMSREEKAGNADFVIDNSMSFEDLEKSVKFILNIVKEV